MFQFTYSIETVIKITRNKIMYYPWKYAKFHLFFVSGELRIKKQTTFLIKNIYFNE